MTRNEKVQMYLREGLEEARRMGYIENESDYCAAYLANKCVDLAGEENLEEERKAPHAWLDDEKAFDERYRSNEYRSDELGVC